MRRRIFESLERRQLLAGDVTIFADSFESGSNSNDWIGNWVEDSQNDWFRNTQRATDGSYSAEVDGRATDATLTMTNAVDLSGYDSATLTFDWLIESGFDSGEYVALDVSSNGGASWTNDVLRLDGNSDPENIWHSETVDLTSFSSSEALVRFRSKVSRSSEDANVDNVRIVGTESVVIDPAKPVKVFLLAGHSNVTGTGAAENLDPAWNVPQDDVLIWLDHDMDSDGNWVTLEPGHGWGTHAPRPDEPEGLDPRNGVGPELGLGRTLADAHPDHQVVLIKHGRGGGTIGSDWSPENVGPSDSEDHMWSGLLQKTYDALSTLDAAGPAYEVSGFFFALGAKDAANWNASSSDPAEVAAGEEEALLRSAEYGENLTTFITTFRDEFSADMPFVMTRIREDVTPELLAAYPGADLVRQGQLDVEASVPGTTTFTGDGITLRDSVHYDAMGQIEFGTRFADAYLDLISTGSPNVPPDANAGVDQSFSDGDGSGSETATLNGSGSDQDGSVVSYQWTEGSTVMGDSASISPSLSVGTHTLTLTVTDDDGATSSDDVVVTVVANQGPTANAGSNQILTDNDDNGSESITLVGSGSDSDGSIVSYLWNDGTNDIGNTASISPTLAVGTHTLTLTVTDNGGATSSDGVVITVVAAANQDPAADAGSDATLSDNDGTGAESITLNGSGSDPDGSIVAYQWIEGATSLGNTASISLSLSVGTHTLTLTVTDDDGTTASDDVVVTVVANEGPTANAGADQIVTDSDDNGSETITLVGSGADADGSIVSYQWSDGTSVIGNTASISPTLGVGSHTLTLTVTDNGGASSSDSVDVTVETAKASGPNLSHGDLPNVTSDWQTVTLDKSYTSMVVVATPRYNSNSGPGVVRINNASGASFDVRVDNAGSSPFSGGVHYIVVEEGVYEEPGFKLEAVKYDEAQTSHKNGWGIDTVGYQQSYNSPVVVGQVMTANDEDFSVFWASSGSRTSPPTSSALNVGKHVAEDPDTTRSTETIGYLVIEATQSGMIEGLPFVAGVGGDTVRGVDDGTYQYNYDAMPNAKTAVLSSAGMDGGDGGWAVLRGDNPVPATSGTISLSIDEDQLRDSERNHTTEQVAYLVIDPPLQQVARREQAVPVALPTIRISLSSDQIVNANVDAALAALDDLRPSVIQDFAIIDTAVRAERTVMRDQNREIASTKAEDVALLDLLKLDSMH